MWFSFDGEDFETHNTADEAKSAAVAALDDYRSEAADGWSDAAYNVCWGRVVEAATVTVKRPREQTDCVDPDIDTIQEIELRGDGATVSVSVP
jgi:hypothetical protein